MKIATTQTLKFKKLQRRLKLPLWQAIGVLEAIWKMTYRNAPAGDIGRLSNEDIAAAIEWEGNADDLIDGLIETGWIDTDPTHRLLIHDWKEECEAWHRGHMERYGKTFAQPLNQPSVKLDTSTASSVVCNDRLQRSTDASLPIPTLTNPSSPSLNPPAPDPEPLGAAWQEVVVVLKSEGMGGAEQACEACRSNGCHTGEAMRAIEHWQQHKPQWGIGFLYKRLEYMKPGESHLRGWPEANGPPSEHRQVELKVFKAHIAQGDFLVGPKRENPTGYTRVYGQLKTKAKIESHTDPNWTPSN